MCRAEPHTFRRLAAIADPPKHIRDVMKAFVIITGARCKTAWAQSRVFLDDMDMLEETIVSFSNNTFNEKSVSRVEKFCRMKPSPEEYEEGPVAAIARWIHAACNFARLSLGA